MFTRYTSLLPNSVRIALRPNTDDYAILKLDNLIFRLYTKTNSKSFLHFIRPSSTNYHTLILIYAWIVLVSENKLKTIWFLRNRFRPLISSNVNKAIRFCYLHYNILWKGTLLTSILKLKNISYETINVFTIFHSEKLLNLLNSY